MKKIALILALLVSTSAFARDRELRDPLSKVIRTIAKIFNVNDDMSVPHP